MIGEITLPARSAGGVISPHVFRTVANMNTKILMTSTSIFLGVAGLLALLAPQDLLAALGSPPTNPMPILVQLMGALYFSLALTNWTAKGNAIGGIYARPISLGNFAHFLVGALVLVRHQLSNGISPLLLVALIVYAVFAAVFGWLVFASGGITTKRGT